MRGAIGAVVISVGLGACAGDPPPLALSSARSPAPDPSSRVIAPTPAPLEIPLEEPHSLDPIAFEGPSDSLDDLFGGPSKRTVALPKLGGVDEIVLAEGPSARSSQPATMRSTRIAYRLGKAWYGSPLFHTGEGVDHLEIFNPPSVNGGVPLRVNRSRTFAGRVRNTTTLTDPIARVDYVAVDYYTTDEVPENVITLCAMNRDRPVCSDVVTTAEIEHGPYAITNGVLTISFNDGSSYEFRMPEGVEP